MIRATETGVTRILCPLLCVIAAVLLDGCSEHEAPALSRGPLSAPSLELLRVGTSGDYPPFSRDGTGFDVEVAKLVAADLGARLEFVPFRWPELRADIEADRFDVAMGGITWRADRAVLGRMSRAYAVGGPCLVSLAPSERGERAFARVAVNRGGILERWARENLPASTIQTTDDNLSLPTLLASGQFDAFVTDSFEVEHFRQQGQHVDCEPPTDRKVYWIAPSRAETLGVYLDRWIRDNEARLSELRSKHFGAPLLRDDLDHVIDMVARRLELMPSVAAYKRERGVPIEDLAREATVLEGAGLAASQHHLDQRSVRALFALQIELAKAIQRRTPAETPSTLDLTDQIRPTLLSLGDRILEAIGDAAETLATLDRSRLDLLEPQLEQAEIERLLDLLRTSDWRARSRSSAGGQHAVRLRCPLRDEASDLERHFTRLVQHHEGAPIGDAPKRAVAKRSLQTLGQTEREERIGVTPQ